MVIIDFWVYCNRHNSHLFFSSITPTALYKYSIFQMTNHNQPRVTVLVILIALLALTQSCTVCNKCTNCGPEILADTYLDGIDALLQSKVQNLGYPVQIQRVSNSTDITYSINYSNGLSVVLSLTLSNMQIQLVNYSLNSQSQTVSTFASSSSGASTSTSSSSSSSAVSSRSADGYYTVANFGSDRQVSLISNFVSQLIKTNISSFKLVAAAYSNSSSSLVYRLSYQVLPIKQINLIQDVYVEVNANSYKYITTNYSGNLQTNWVRVSLKSITDDSFLQNINTLILKNYGSMLGSNAAVIDVMVSPPYYQITYQVENSNYTFIVLYDYLQSRIISGNGTKSTITQTVSTSTMSSSNRSTNSQTATTSTQTQSSSTGYQQITNYQNNPVISAVLKALSTSSFSFSPSMLATAQQANINGLSYYKIIIFLSQVGSMQLKNPLYYQFIVTSTDNQSFKIANASYVQLSTPNLVNLTLADIQNDINVQRIAVFILHQKYALIPPESQVVLVARDFPYYRLVFDNKQNVYVTVNVLFNFYSAEVQVLSVTSNSFGNTQKTATAQQTKTQTNTNTVSSTTGSATTAAPQVLTQTRTSNSQTAPITQGVQNAAGQTQFVPLTPVKLVNDSTTTVKTSSNTRSGSTSTSSVSVSSNTQNTNVPKTTQTNTNSSATAPKPPSNTQTASSTQTITTSATTNTQQTSSGPTSLVSGTSKDDQSVINIQNETYLKASSSLTNQNYVSLYLKYLAATNFRFQAANLIGIYINSCMPNTLLFRYYYGGQYFNQITSTSDIQQTLTQNLGGTVKTQSATINQTSTRTNTTNNSASSSTANSQQSQVNYGGVTYVITTSAFSSQSFIKQYLEYLAANFKSYETSNLVGIYANPQNTNSLLFRFRNNNQFINLASNVNDIQQLLKLSQSKTQTNGATSTQSTGSATKTTTTQTNPSTVATSTATTTNTKVVSQTTNNTNTTPTVNLQQVNISLVPARPQQTTGSQTQTTNLNTQQTTITTQQTTGQTTSNSQQNSIQLSPMTKVDPKCLCWDKGNCIRCAHRFYLSNNKCIEIPKECLSYDLTTGACRSCLPGYQIKAGVCQKEETTAYYFNNQCFACFSNYKMVNQRCVYSPSTKDSSISVVQAKNVLCVSWRGESCVQCMPGTYLSSRGMCQLIDPFCSLFDYVLQSCNTCQRGYSLRNGRCFKI